MCFILRKFTGFAHAFLGDAYMDGAMAGELLGVNLAGEDFILV